VELAIDYRHVFANGIGLSVGGQFTDYKTIVSKYESAEDPLISSTYYEGKVLGEIWGYKTEGLFQDHHFEWDENGKIKTEQIGDKITNVMAPGVATQHILESGQFRYSPGDVRYKDLNGDGEINFGSNTVGDPGDRTVIGNTTPRYQFGVRLGADWKGFDFSMFVQGVGKRHIWATGNIILPGFYGAEANFAHTLDYWTPENTDAFYPRPIDHGQGVKWNYLPNDRYLMNASYARLKNVTLGYTIPNALSSRVGIQRARVYFSGENLFELDKMGDVPIDPELDWTDRTSRDARNFGRSYPYRRTVSFGLQVQL